MAGFTVVSSVVAQEMTGDNATMSGNMTGGNVTGGNMTESSGTVSDMGDTPYRLNGARLVFSVSECELHQDFILDLLLLFKFPIFNSYNIYGTAILTPITKVRHITKCLGSKIVKFSAFLTCIYNRKENIRKVLYQ